MVRKNDSSQQEIANASLKAKSFSSVLMRNAALESSKEKTRKHPTILHRTVGITRLERKATHSLERSSFILAQTEILPAPITKAVPLLSEDHHFFDVGKLFERSINFRGHTRICTDPRRLE